MNTKRSEILAVIIFLLATVGAVVGIFAVEKIRRNKNFTAELIARAPEYGNWYPRTLRVPYGEEVTIMIRNIDTVTHGFTAPDLNLSLPEIKAGQVKVISFVADRKGSFPFMCTVWCSSRHMEMRGELIVE